MARQWTSVVAAVALLVIAASAQSSAPWWHNETHGGDNGHGLPAAAGSDMGRHGPFAAQPNASTALVSSLAAKGSNIAALAQSLATLYAAGNVTCMSNDAATQQFINQVYALQTVQGLEVAYAYV
jgi:hypothetical protein